MIGAEMIEACVRRILRDDLHLEPPDDQSDLIDSGLLDSLSFVELLYQIENRFGVRAAVEELDLDDFRSVARIAGFVRRTRRDTA